MCVADMKIHEGYNPAGHALLASNDLQFEPDVDFEVSKGLHNHDIDISFYHPDAIDLIMNEDNPRLAIEFTPDSSLYDDEGTFVGVRVSYETTRLLGMTGLPKCLGGEGKNDNRGVRNAFALTCVAVQKVLAERRAKEFSKLYAHIPSPTPAHNN